MKKVTVPGHYAGKKIECPKCHGEVTVPGEVTMDKPGPKRVILKKPNKWTPVLKVVAMLLIVGIAITATILFMRGGGGGPEEYACVKCEADGEKVSFETKKELAKHITEVHPPDGPGPEPGKGMIRSLDNEATIAEAVGLVINAWDTIDKDGVQEEVPYLPFVHTAEEYRELPDEVKAGMQPYRLPDGSAILYIERILGAAGTCFLISDDGLAITNQHVVEEFDRITKANSKRDKIKERLKLEKADPILLVFFNGKEHKAALKFVHPKFDFAIIKIDGISEAPYFGLAASDEIKRGKEVIVLGFPGAATGILPGEEGEAALRATSKKIKDFLPQIAFDYVQTKGNISSPQDRTIGRLILHDAVINHGNSGGPLVDKQARVLGINTFGISDGGKQGTFMSVQMKQLKLEIDQNVQSVVWR